MGYRQTMFVTWTWLIAAMTFFGLVVYRLVNGGLTWLFHSSEALIAVGIIAFSAYSALMFSQLNESINGGNKQRDREHDEAMKAIRAVYQELGAPIRSIESTVENLDRNTNR